MASIGSKGINGYIWVSPIYLAFFARCGSEGNRANARPTVLYASTRGFDVLDSIISGLIKLKSYSIVSLPFSKFSAIVISSVA